jgi:transcriptional regulator with XRE-family HTH domain
MTQKEMSELLNVPVRTLAEWKKNNRKDVYTLLHNLDLNTAKDLLKKSDETTYLKVLENEKYFDNQLDFEQYLYPLLLNRDTKVWKKFAINKTLSQEVRVRSAYLYSYLSEEPVKLGLKLKEKVSFFHKNKTQDGDGFAKYYGLLNGLDNRRFNQFKNTGSF